MTTWTSCSERMPPDDGTKIIVKEFDGTISETSGDVMHRAWHLIRKLGGGEHVSVDAHWVLYTHELWEELKR